MLLITVDHLIFLILGPVNAREMSPKVYDGVAPQPALLPCFFRWGSEVLTRAPPMPAPDSHNRAAPSFSCKSSEYKSRPSVSKVVLIETTQSTSLFTSKFIHNLYTT